jgi:hypothetical protein
MKELRQLIAGLLCFGYIISAFVQRFHGVDPFNSEVLGLLWLIISLI